MKEQRYILEKSIATKYNGKNCLTPSLNAENVEDKDLFYTNMFLSKEEMKSKRVDNSLNREEIDKIILKDWKFDYLEPEHYDDSKVNFICDYHTWVGKQPDRIHGNPISQKMKEILEDFNIFPEKKFYDAKVLFQNKKHEYYIWEMNTDSFNTYVDFEHSTFCEVNRDGELGDDTIMVKNIDELRNYRMEKEWRQWSFKKAVMKPEYKDIDCAKLAYPYITIISERLKNALEEANLILVLKLNHFL